MSKPLSRDEEILLAILNGTDYDEAPLSRIEELLIELQSVISGGNVPLTTDMVVSHMYLSGGTTVTISADTPYFRTLEIPVEPNTTYTLSGMPTTTKRVGIAPASIRSGDVSQSFVLRSGTTEHTFTTYDKGRCMFLQLFINGESYGGIYAQLDASNDKALMDVILSEIQLRKS